ncbi:MAG: ATP-binding protein, partial [Bacteroidota bacterium]
EGVQRPNGLLALENGHLLLGDTNGRELLMVNPADGSKEVFAKGVEPDGIIAVGDGSYVVSRWGGQIHHVSATGETTLLLDTEAAGSQTADIAYNQEEGLILVPTFFQNKVVAYRLKM